MLLLSTVAVSMHRRFPPYVVIQRKHLQCGQTQDSHPVFWRNDPSQEVRALSQNILRNAQASNIRQLIRIVKAADGRCKERVGSRPVLRNRPVEQRTSR